MVKDKSKDYNDLGNLIKDAKLELSEIPMPKTIKELMMDAGRYAAKFEELFKEYKGSDIKNRVAVAQKIVNAALEASKIHSDIGIYYLDTKHLNCEKIANNLSMAEDYSKLAQDYLGRFIADFFKATKT